jgi:hypothetical protein
MSVGIWTTVEGILLYGITFHMLLYISEKICKFVRYGSYPHYRNL